MKIFMVKIITLTIVFVMIFNFSSVVLAEGVELIKDNIETKEEQITEEVVTNAETEEKEPVEIIGEDKSKRTLNEKHFK